ncbi:MAG: DUF1566 domain-containing protein [Cryomorphaceae bacterium]|nr:DUF1566 domain-containing protein [Cryomorphaceae bacterium]
MKRIFFTPIFSLAIIAVSGQIQQEAVCDGDSITIELPAAISGSAIQWRSGADSLNFTDLAGETGMNLTVMPSATTFYYANISGDNCDPYSSDTIRVDVSAPPSIADAGDDITDSTNSVTLDGAAPTSGVGTWSILPGSGSNAAFSNVNDPQSTFTGDPNETYILAWTVQNPPCPPSIDTIVVNLGVASAPPLPSITCLNNTIYVHPTDNAGPTAWGCPGSGTAQSSSDVDGQANTSAIMTNCPNPNTTAAAVCANLTAFGFSDWYLPAFDELDCLRDNLSTLSGFSNGGYWSSTEFTGILALNAKMRTFPTGMSGASSKTSTHRIRCIRR